jgi:hypothetical protein
VNGNPTLLDLGGIPSILDINTNGSLELRDLLIKNVAPISSLRNATCAALERLTFVSGMLTWPSFFAQPGANLRIYNTTQYYWSDTLYRRPDCKWGAHPSAVPVNEQVLSYAVFPSYALHRALYLSQKACMLLPINSILECRRRGKQDSSRSHLHARHTNASVLVGGRGGCAGR